MYVDIKSDSIYKKKKQMRQIHNLHDQREINMSNNIHLHDL